MHVLTLYVISHVLLYILCPIPSCIPWNDMLACSQLDHVAIRLFVDSTVVWLVMVLGWDNNVVVVVHHVVHHVVHVLKWQGRCSCVHVFVSSLLLVVGLLCHGVSTCSLFLFFFSHPLPLIC